MSLGSFQTRNGLQFIPYEGPQQPKLTSRRDLSKKMPSNEHEYLSLDGNLTTGPALTSHQAEDVDLAFLASENICELDSYGCGCRDLDSEDGFLPQNGRQNVGVEHFIPGRTTRGTPFEGSSQEYAIVIEDSQPESDATTDEKGCPREDELGTQTHGHFGTPGMATWSYRGTEGVGDAISLERVQRPESQASGHPRRELSSTPSTLPTGSSIMEIGQPTQEASGDIFLEAHVTMHQPQVPVDRQAEEQGKLAHLESVSSNSSGRSDNDTADDTGNGGTRLTRKRKRSAPCKWHSRTSSTTSKRHPRHAAHLARQRKPSSRGRPLPNRPSNPRPLSAAPYSGYDTKICYSDDSSDDSSEESSNRGRYLGSNKRPKLTRPSRSRNRGSVDKDDEYEVEQILEARVYRRKLQYRVKWLGYEVDPVWYDASNFKNSPRKLREFHDDNPASLGPPERLEVWLRCWEEDRDADDHSDDNKPQRSHTGRGTLRIAEPCGYSLRRYTRLPASTVQRQEAMR